MFVNSFKQVRINAPEGAVGDGSTFQQNVFTAAEPDKLRVEMRGFDCHLRFLLLLSRCNEGRYQKNENY